MLSPNTIFWSTNKCWQLNQMTSIIKELSSSTVYVFCFSCAKHKCEWETVLMRTLHTVNGTGCHLKAEKLRRLSTFSPLSDVPTVRSYPPWEFLKTDLCLPLSLLAHLIRWLGKSSSQTVSHSDLVAPIHTTLTGRHSRWDNHTSCVFLAWIRISWWTQSS